MIIVDILELSRIFICHNKFETRLCREKYVWVSNSSSIGATFRKFVSSHSPRYGEWNNDEGEERKRLL